MSHFIVDKRRRWVTDLLLLGLLIGSAFAFMLGNRPLNVPDEARYCEIPREMLVTHDFITPRLNGIKYFEKPPLFYWMQATALRFFPFNEWTFRSVEALMAVIGCLGTYAASRWLFGRPTGLFSAAILASSLLYFALARVVTLDMTVSIFLSFTLLSFICAVQLPVGFSRRLGFYLCYLFAGLALLSKGLIAILLPGAIVFIWLFLTQRWYELKHAYLPTGLLLFASIGLPWHLLAQHFNPEFFHFYFVNQQFLRYFTMEAGRYQPFWFYMPILFLGLFPWTGFLWGALKRLKQKNTQDLFFSIWAAVIFLFFSISKSKLVPYVLPCLVPLAILIGRYFSSLKKSEKNKSLIVGISVTVLTSIALIGGILVCFKPSMTTDFISAHEALRVVVAVLAVNSIAVPLIYWQKGFLSAFVAQLTCSVAFLLSLCATVPYIYMDSIKPLAETLKPLLKPTDKVVTYDYYYQDLPFYLQRYVTIVNWQGELLFGLQHQKSTDLWMTEKTLWQQWSTRQTIYLVVSHYLLHQLKAKTPYHFYPIAQGKNDDIVTNHEQ